MGISTEDAGPTAMTDNAQIHTSVMLERTIELLAPALDHDGPG